MKIDLKNKNAVITGATGELGRTMARSLAGCGANVAICYYKEKEFADELKNEIENKYSVNAVVVQTDVTDLNSIMAMKKEVKDILGVADIIVNNAVIQLSEWESVIDQSNDDFESQFKSCVMHIVNMAKVSWFSVIWIDKKFISQLNIKISL